MASNSRCPPPMVPKKVSSKTAMTVPAPLGTEPCACRTVIQMAAPWVNFSTKAFFQCTDLTFKRYLFKPHCTVTKCHPSFGRFFQNDPIYQATLCRALCIAQTGQQGQLSSLRHSTLVGGMQFDTSASTPTSARCTHQSAFACGQASGASSTPIAKLQCTRPTRIQGRCGQAPLQTQW